MVVYEKCNSELRKCKDEEIIEETLKESYILIIENE